MFQSPILRSAALGEANADAVIAIMMAAADDDRIEALYELGVIYSTGAHGQRCDLVEAHRWFNLAAVRGHEEAAMARADISEEMSAREIAAAQRLAREWLNRGCRAA